MKACWLWTSQRRTMICAPCLSFNACLFVPSFFQIVCQLWHVMVGIQHTSRPIIMMQETAFNSHRTNTSTKSNPTMPTNAPFPDKVWAEQTDGTTRSVSLLCARRTVCTRSRWKERMTASIVTWFQIRVSTLHCRTTIVSHWVSFRKLYYDKNLSFDRSSAQLSSTILTS